MTTLSTFLTKDHQHCDDLFAEAESAVGAGDWSTGKSRFERFRDDTLRHFRREEGVLFPAFEAHTGMPDGPTTVMRREHAQMRAVLEDMAAALAERNASDYFGHADTLLLLMRQHNLKEEQILYPMADKALGDLAAGLIAHMTGENAG